ncbi:TerB N-terminal domain-containing protein [Pandoraea sp. NPDC087047]|uniref:tellurite resistance TerB family protein n=1 Tax=Pandoraea sp. NPDC087047 TaxID=3364390 RepID=UPI00382F905F
MSQKKRISGIWHALLAVGIVFVFVAAPNGGWKAFLLVALLWVTISALRAEKSNKFHTSAQSEVRPRNDAYQRSTEMPTKSLHTSDEENFVTVRLAERGSETQFQIAPPPVGLAQKVRWVPKGESVVVGGTAIDGGLFYLGTVPGGDKYYGLDACVVNSNLKVATAGDSASTDGVDYWQGYGGMSPAQRRNVIDWLASSRSDTNAHRSCVNFYISGLERRVLVDGFEGRVDKSELSAIGDELRRLKATFPNQVAMGALDMLLDAVFIQSVHPGRTYEHPPEPSENYFEVPLAIRVAFGQAAVDKTPVPVAWALAWVLADGAVVKRTPAHRCEREFKLLFRRRYAEQFREGIKLTENKTKLQVRSRTLLPALYNVTYPDYITSLPDQAALTGPRKKLQQLTFECTDMLDAYSRFLGRNPDSAGSLEGMLLLPRDLWSESANQEIDRLKAAVISGAFVATFDALFKQFNATSGVTRDKLAELASVLDKVGIGMEPDVRISGRTPKSTDFVALYSCPVSGKGDLVDGAFLTQALMVDMAASVAMADGSVSDQELQLIYRQIDSWPQTYLGQRERLKARVQVQIAQPPTQASLKKRLEPLPPEARSAVAHVVVGTANADGVVTPAEVKLLEKLYQLLGLDPKRLYSDLHGATVGSSFDLPNLATSSEQRLAGYRTVEFALDTARIEALQKETAKVSEMLAKVFAEDESIVEKPTEGEAAYEAGAVSGTGLLGLDESHSTLLRLLLSRSSWTRAELSDATSGLDLMLDGAIEQVNEASLDYWDEPLIDGDDPFEINQELAQRLVT